MNAKQWYQRHHHHQYHKIEKKMLLGKRPRPPMKRTTSMTEIMFDLNTPASSAADADAHNPFKDHPKPPAAAAGGIEGLDQRFLSSLVSPRNNRRHSGDFSNFLRSCGLCKRRLVPGRDIYMYRGDTAFCSLECRQQQMNQDERKEKCSVVASKKDAAATAVGGPPKSTKTETVAAV